MGHLGNGLVVNGVNSTGARTDAALPSMTEVTVSLWVQRTGAGTAFPRITSWDNDAFEIADYASGGNLGVYTPTLNWQNTGQAFGSGFHHVAVTIGAGTMTVYFDGALVKTYSTNVNLSGKFTMGTRWNNVETWVGGVDHVRVFNRVLTQQEITLLASE